MHGKSKSVYTIKKEKDFKRIYSKGEYFISSALVTYVYKTRGSSIKYGVTASKKVGIAVKRNRARRLIKESFKKLSPDIKPGYSFVFVARAYTCSKKCQDIYYNMSNHLKRAGVLK